MDCASSYSRQELAQVALGEGAVKDSGFYSSLHQESLEGTSTCQNKHKDTPDFTCSQWDLIRASIKDGSEDQEVYHEELPDVEKTCESVAEDLKRRLRETPLILLGSHQFVRSCTVVILAAHA